MIRILVKTLCAGENLRIRFENIQNMPDIKNVSYILQLYFATCAIVYTCNLFNIINVCIFSLIVSIICENKVK